MKEIRGFRCFSTELKPPNVQGTTKSVLLFFLKKKKQIHTHIPPGFSTPYCLFIYYQKGKGGTKRLGLHKGGIITTANNNIRE